MVRLRQRAGVLLAVKKNSISLHVRARAPSAVHVNSAEIQKIITPDLFQIGDRWTHQSKALEVKNTMVTTSQI